MRGNAGGFRAVFPRRSGRVLLLLTVAVWAGLLFADDPPPQPPPPNPPPPQPTPPKVEVPRPYVSQFPDDPQYTPAPQHASKWYKDPALPSRGTMMCGPGCGVSILGHFAQLYPGLGDLLKPENLAQTVEGMAVQIATNFPVNPWDIAQGWDTPGVSSFPGSSSENLGEGIKEFLESHGFNDSSYSVTDNPASMVNEIMTNTPKRGSAVILCLEKGQGTDRQWHFVTVCGWEYLSSTGQWKLKIMDPLSELTWDPNPGWVWFSSQDSKYVLIDVDSETSVWRFYKAITIKIPEPACLLLLGTGMLLVLHRKRARR